MGLKKALLDNEKILLNHFPEFKKSILQTIKKVNDLEKEGDIYKFIVASSAWKDKITQYDKYHSEGLKSSIDICNGYTINKSDITNIEDLEFGVFYNTTLISAIANKFNIVKGMYFVDDGLGERYVIVKATIHGDAYQNEWLIKNKLLKYYMENESDINRKLFNFRHTPNLELYSRFFIGEPIDVHLFYRDNSDNDYIYAGIYFVNNIIDDNKAFELINSRKITKEDVINEEKNYRTIIEKQNESFTGDVYIKGMVNQRTKQGLFRQLQLNSKKHHCEICEIHEKEFLIASHIKPYSKSKNDLQSVADVDNGLLLCPNHDHLFDRGLISFDDNGRILISSQLDKDSIELFGLSKNMKIGVNQRKIRYLTYHRKFIFKI
ncbi:MAG: HNH endonuclease signature motif containing protein [Bacillota bacterium]